MRLNGMKAFGASKEDKIFIYSPDRNKPEILSLTYIESYKTDLKNVIVKFYVNFRHIIRFHLEDKNVNNISIGIFAVEADNLAILNEMLEGKIDIL